VARPTESLPFLQRHHHDVWAWREFPPVTQHDQELPRDRDPRVVKRFLASLLWGYHERDSCCALLLRFVKLGPTRVLGTLGAELVNIVNSFLTESETWPVKHKARQRTITAGSCPAPLANPWTAPPRISSYLEGVFKCGHRRGMKARAP